MPESLDEPYINTSINLFEADVEALRRAYGRGWTEVVRNLTRKHVREITKPQTVGDLYGRD